MVNARHVEERAIDGKTADVGVERRGATSGLSLREVLASYDEEVERSLGQAMAATLGLERVRILHNRVRPAIVVHDAVLSGAL